MIEVLRDFSWLDHEIFKTALDSFKAFHDSFETLENLFVSVWFLNLFKTHYDSSQLIYYTFKTLTHFF